MFGEPHEMKRAALGLAVALGIGFAIVTPASAKPGARERTDVRASRDVDTRSKEERAHESRRGDAELEEREADVRERRDEPSQKDARSKRTTSKSPKGKKGDMASPKGDRSPKQSDTAPRPVRGPGELQPVARQGSDRFRPSNAGGSSIEQRRVLPAQARRDTSTGRLERPIEPARKTRRGESSELEQASNESEARPRPRTEGEMQQAESTTSTRRVKSRRSARARRMK